MKQELPDEEDKGLPWMTRGLSPESKKLVGQLNDKPESRKLVEKLLQAKQKPVLGFLIANHSYDS